MAKVDFFIAGVQKSGTTALDRYLRQHASIRMAKRKELHFFDDEAVDWTAPDYSRLHQAFDWNAPSGIVRGEATPIYTYWPNALDRLKQYNPSAKIIVGLRHPAFRAYSHWRMEAKRGADNVPFAEAIRAGRQRVAASPGGAHRVFSYVERGYYFSQMDRLVGLFSRPQVLFFRTDRLWENPNGILRQVQDLLGIPAFDEISPSYIVPEFTWTEAVPAPEDRAYLDALYADDIRQTAGLTGLALDDWLDSSYAEQMRPSGDRTTYR
jgi:hypothetical protein